MEYRKLGGSGVKVSKLCLGAMTFGEADANSMMHGISADESTSFAMMDRATEAGVNFIDTADIYGQDGLSERVVGAWMRSRGTRDATVLATKCRFPFGSGPNQKGASRLHIMNAVEGSLRRLGTDRIDLMQIHMQDNDTPEEETLRALDDLVRAGKILYIGCSNYAAYRMADSQWISRTQHLSRYVTFQAQYSLVVRDLEREHIPLCKAHDIGLLPWSPLAGGFLTGKYRKDAAPPEGSRLAKWRQQLDGFDTPRHWKILDAVDQVAKETEASAAQVSLAWLAQKPTVSSVIFGARNMAQLEDNLAAAELTLTEAQMTALDEASAWDLGYPYGFMNQFLGGW